MTDAQAVPRSPRPASSDVSWYALVGPAVAWGAQELTSTFVTIEACAHGAPGLARGALVAISIVALGISTSAGVLGYRRWKRTSGGFRKLVDDEGRERRDMLALVSVVLSVVLTLSVVWCGLPALLVSDLCGAQR